jgi:hypothetical protein
MEAIINLWQEQLHDIFVGTRQGRKLRLRFDHDEPGFRLAGEFYEIDDRSWYLVEFSKSRVSHADALFAACLANLEIAMKKKSDAIQEIHNTTDTPMVSIDKQKEIISRLGIQAQIRVN